MPVPSSITDLSQTAASNYPAGTDSPATLDDVQRAHASFIALLRDGKGRTNRATLASASTTDIGGKNSLFVEVTGTTTITSLGTSYNGPRYVKFSGALTLTHNATLMNLIGGASITTAAGDFAVFIPNTAVNGWDMVMYQRASGAALVAPGAATESASGIVELATVAETQAGIDAVRAVTPAGLAATAGKQMESVGYTIASNALTLKLNPTTLAFRSTNLTSGAPVLVSNAAQITTTISSGSTGGTVNGVQSDIVILAINNSGTMELAWCNLAGGISLDETQLISTTAEGGAGAADSATTIYSTTARTNVAYRVVGIFRSTQTTAGTWATAPSLVQGCGGQALAALSSLGYGQTWQNVAGSRVLGTTYTNTTSRPIQISFTGGANATYTAAVAGLTVASWVQNNSAANANIVVPPGSTYSITAAGGSITVWTELR